MKLGFIGLGAMGQPMALNLMKGGHDMAVWSRRPASAQALVQAGAALYPTPAEVARNSDVVFTMVTAGKDVEAVVLGAEGLAEGGRPGFAIVDCSTIDAVTARHVAATLAERGIEMLDAPVSGGEAGAQQGTLSVMIGGPEALYRRLEGVLGCIGKTLVHVGPNGAGQVVKAANQLALVMTIQGIAEAMVFARANDVDVVPVFSALTQGLAGSRMLEVFGRRMLDRAFVDGIDAGLHHKDVHIVLETAKSSLVAMPGAGLAAQAFNALFAEEGVRWDSAAILKVLEALSGFPERAQA